MTQFSVHFKQLKDSINNMMFSNRQITFQLPAFVPALLSFRHGPALPDDGAFIRGRVRDELLDSRSALSEGGEGGAGGEGQHNFCCNICTFALLVGSLNYVVVFPLLHP